MRVLPQPEPSLKTGPQPLLIRTQSGANSGIPSILIGAVGNADKRSLCCQSGCTSPALDAPRRRQPGQNGCDAAG